MIDLIKKILLHLFSRKMTKYREEKVSMTNLEYPK